MNNSLTKLSPIATVVNVSGMKQDTNGRNFKTLRLEGINKTVEVIGGIEYPVMNRGKQVSMNQWEENYLNDSKDPFFDAQIGDHLAVEIYTAQVKPYEITDTETGEVREVESITFPVIRGDNPVTILKNRDLELKTSDAVEQEETLEEAVEAEATDDSLV